LCKAPVKFGNVTGAEKKPKFLRKLLESSCNTHKRKRDPYNRAKKVKTSEVERKDGKREESI
jgi:hypothetical protein